MPHEAVDTPKTAVTSTTAHERLARPAQLDIDDLVEDRLGNSMVRQTVWTMRNGLCVQTGMSTTTGEVQRVATVGARLYLP